MTAPSRLCPGCFLADRADGACPECGFDPEVVEYRTVLRPGGLLQDRYQVGRVLGEPGGFGVTYLAWDERLHRRIALKELMPRELVARDPDGSTLRPHSTSGQDLFTYTRESFLNEARMVARFKHPNLVKVLDYFEANNTAYFAMEFYEGRTLDGLMNKKGRPLTSEEVVALARPVLEAFEEVHAEGVLHRDVKPSNIYIREGGDPILLDFGAARQTLENTRKLTSILTPGYAPLEQYDTDGNQGPWTDVYGCAATFYFALTGQQPTEALRRLQGTAMPSPRELVPTVDPGVDEAIMRGMAMEIAHRTHSAEAFLADLEGEAPPASAASAPDATAFVAQPLAPAPAAPAPTADLRSDPHAGAVGVGEGAETARIGGDAGEVAGSPAATEGDGTGVAMVHQGAGTEVAERPQARHPARKVALGAAAVLLIAVPVGALVFMGGDDEVVPPPVAAGAQVGQPGGEDAGQETGAPTEEGGGPTTVAGGESAAPASGGDVTAAAGADPGVDEGAGDASSGDPEVAEPPPAAAAESPPSDAPAAGEAAVDEPGTRLVVLVMGEGGEARVVETAILRGMLRVGEFEALDAEGLQVMRADPSAIRGALGGDFGRLADVARSVGAEFVAVGALESQARPSAGRFFGGSAQLEVRLYRTSTRRLVNTRTFQVGGEGTPPKLGNTEADARRQAVEAVATQAVLVLQRWMRLALR